MGDKPEVLDAVLKETVDLARDLNAFLVFALWICFWLDFDGFVCVFLACFCAGEHSH